MIETLVKTLDFNVDVKRVREELQVVDRSDQVLLQTVLGQDYLYGARSGRDVTEPENAFVHFCWETPYINSIITHFKLVRSRVMNLASKTCLSYHRDPTFRFHLPVYTNENCFLIIDKQVHHLPVGKCYIINSTLPHTAVNASWEGRTHIIGTVDKL